MVVEVEVFIDVLNPDVLDRVNDPEWAEHMGDDWDERDVLKHLAFNAVQNQTSSAADLDGWADLPRNAALMTSRVTNIEVDDQ